MKSHSYQLGRKRQTGFSLVENMVSIVLLSIGSLGIAASTATAIRTNTDNQARAMALAAATKTLEPVYIRAQDPYPTDPDVVDLQTLIKSFAGAQEFGGVTVHGNVASGASDDFIVSVTQAVDAAGTNVLTTVGPYESPVTVGVLVRYMGIAGHQDAQGVQEVSNIKEVRTSLTYVLGG